MSSNVDDLLYGHLLESVQAMNETLKHWLVGGEDCRTFSVAAGKNFAKKTISEFMMLQPRITLNVYNLSNTIASKA